MAIKIEMPKLSDTMEEGVLSKWNIKEGDKVSAGDIIADVETDKATMEMEAFDAGTVLKLLVKEGETIPLGGVVAILGEPGEDISALLAGSGGGSAAPAAPIAEPSGSAPSAEPASKPPAAPAASFDPIFGGIGAGSGAASAPTSTSASAPTSTPAAATSAPVASSGGRVKASPLARKIAQEKGLDLSMLAGSGPDGRIVKKDVESARPGAAAMPAATAALPRREDQVVKVSQMRKAIARRLSESKFTNPHFYVTVDVDMDQAVSARTQINELSPVKVSFNDLVVKACALALRQHPWVNASWFETEIHLHGSVHVAFAVAVDEGLVTPVIRDADHKPLSAIAQEAKSLAGLARDRKLQPAQMEGSTFTISNLGMFGVDGFTAIINPPNAAILAVGGIRDEAVVRGGAIVPGKRMRITLSSDHRVVDGAKAADFLNTVKRLLENPIAMFAAAL